MRVAIVGAGLAGVTTAFQLASQGHQVSVFERRGSVASEGSFALGGLSAPGLEGAQPLRSFGREMLSLPLGRHQPGWAWQRWQARRDPQAAARHQQLNALALSGQAQLRQWRQQLGIDDEAQAGLLVLLRSAADERAADAILSLTETLKQSPRRLDASQCRQLEPGLQDDPALLGGLQLPQASSCNVRQLTQALKALSQRLGVRWRFHAQVSQLEAGSSPALTHAPMPADLPDVRIQEARSDQGPSTLPQAPEPQRESFDAIVLCAGVGSAELLAPLGLQLPLAALSLHSITAPLRQLEAHPDLGPRAALLDLASGISITRLGQRVRVASLGGLARESAKQDKRIIEQLHALLHRCFPGAILPGSALNWRGARCALPDGLPMIGASGLPGLWLNLGQHDLGASLAIASAALLSDQLTGRPVGAESALFAPARCIRRR